jgi:predicted DNA-binding transcriptional regulator AlpA
MSDNSNTRLIEKRALTPRDVSFMYGLSEGTLANWRCKRTGPRYYKAGPRKVIYFQTDLDSWAKASPVQTVDSIEAAR